MTLSGPAASTLLDLALDLATRLPATARALRGGVLDFPRARLTGRALALRAAGLPGPLEELRARAYPDALLGRDSAPRPAPAGRPGRRPPSCGSGI